MGGVSSASVPFGSSAGELSSRSSSVSMGSGSSPVSSIAAGVAGVGHGTCETV